MAYDPISDGETLTAAYTLANWTNQVISQVTAATNPAGTEGQFIYETDTNYVKGHNGSSFLPFGQLGAWRTWTPTLTQSATVTYTVNHSAYTQIGTLVIAHCALSCTSSGTANNAVQVTLPVTAGGGSFGFGIGYIREISPAGLAVGFANLNSSTTAVLLDATQSTNALALGQTGAAFANALASGDSIQFGIIYESA